MNRIVRARSRSNSEWFKFRHVPFQVCWIAFDRVGLRSTLTEKETYDCSTLSGKTNFPPSLFVGLKHILGCHDFGWHWAVEYKRGSGPAFAKHT